jgi:hypothetical protein
MSLERKMARARAKAQSKALMRRLKDTDAAARWDDLAARFTKPYFARHGDEAPGAELLTWLIDFAVRGGDEFALDDCLAYAARFNATIDDLDGELAALTRENVIVFDSQTRMVQLPQ